MNKNNKKHVNLKNKTMRRKSLSKRSNNKYTQKKYGGTKSSVCEELPELKRFNTLDILVLRFKYPKFLIQNNKIIVNIITKVRHRLVSF